MTDSIIARRPCGCITYWNGEPDHVSLDEQRTLARYVHEGGEVLRVKLDDVRGLPEFLPSECPHQPAGWAREYKARKRAKEAATC